MNDEPESKNNDLGLSIPDAQGIKSALLRAVSEGHIAQDCAHSAACDLVAAFQVIDTEVFTRSESERILRENRA